MRIRSFDIAVKKFYIMFSAMFVIGAVLRGAGDTLMPMFFTLFALWVIRIPASYLLSKEIGVTGIWWGVPTGWVMGVLLSYIYYKTGKWKTKAVVQPK